MLLAEVTKIDRMTLSQSIRTLERKGLVKRIPALTNKRAYHVELTKIGSDIAMQAVRRIITAHEAFFASLAQSTAEYVRLTSRLINANNVPEDILEEKS